jgi:tetratricopeptide (TPR) repeat protein
MSFLGISTTLPCNRKNKNMTFQIGNWIPSVEKLTRWAEGVKSASVTLLAVGAASISGVGIMKAVTSDSVSLDPIKVPAPFEERGFSSEIATARLLDEIMTYQRRSSAAKERVSITGKNSADELDKLQSPSVGGIDIKSIQKAVQETLGVKKERITGEITFQKDGDDSIYKVRLRRVPGNHVLLDISAKGEPEAVLKKTALAMIETFDPLIAASIYWRDRDEQNALRMIEVVLNNDRADDDKYAINLHAYIQITHKRYDAAQKDFEKIMKIDPKFPSAHGMASWLLRAQGDLEGSMREAETTIELAPEKWWGYFQKAQTLRDMKRGDEAEASFNKTLAMKPDAAGPYFQAGQFMAGRNKLGEADSIYRKGLFNFSDSPALHAGYGGVLRKLGQPDEAQRAFGKALELDPKNQLALNGKAELEKSSTNQ